MTVGCLHALARLARPVVLYSESVVRATLPVTALRRSVDELKCPGFELP